MRVKLGEICTIKSSRRIFEKEYVDNGVPFIRGQEISDGSIKEINTKFQCYISKERFEQLKNTNGVPKVNDILITAVGTIGNLFYVNKNFDFYFKDGNVIWLTDFNEKVNSKYLYFFMKSKYFFKQLEYAMIGAVQKALTMVTLAKVEFELPNYKEQTRIANLLERIENKIDNNNKINIELEQMSKIIYDYWFLQFEFPNEEGKPYKSSGGKMVWNEELKREIPQGWKKEKAKDLIEIGNGKDYKHLSTGNIPVYGSGGIITNVNKSLYTGESILIPRKGTLNNVMYVNEEFWTVDTMFYSKVKTENTAIYTYYSIKLYDFERLNTGTSVPSMTSSIINNLNVITPSNDILIRFNNIVKPLYDILYKKRKQNEKLIKLRDYLLPLLMNGQVGFK